MMKLQELIGQTDLDMTPSQVKAFFLGALTAERSLPFPKAMEEMLSETHPDLEQGEELKENLLETWDQYVKIFKQ